jgi:predicted signal transduction protein with EAL and GGDEF domain
LSDSTAVLTKEIPVVQAFDSFPDSFPSEPSRQLRDLPFDELKIDGSFVRGASNDASAKAIVEASVQMNFRLRALQQVDMPQQVVPHAS